MASQLYSNWYPDRAYILAKVYTNSLMLTLNLRRPTSGKTLSGGETGTGSFRMDETNRARSAGGIQVTRTLDVEGGASGIWNQKV